MRHKIKSGWDNLQELCKQEGCVLECREETPTGEQSVGYFKWQGGTFYFMAGLKSSEVVLFYMDFDSLPYSEELLDKVRRLVIQMNSSYRFVKVLYHYNEEKHVIQLKVNIETVGASVEVLRFYLKVCLECANDIRVHLKMRDVPSEETQIELRRHAQMLLEAEQWQGLGEPIRTAVGKKLTIAEIIRHLYMEETADNMLSLMLVNETETIHLTNGEEIAQYNILSCMVKEGQMSQQTPVFNLETTWNHYMLSLHPVEQDDEAIYLRLSIMKMPYDHLRLYAPDSTYTPDALSELIRYDRKADSVTAEPASPEQAFDDKIAYGHQLKMGDLYVQAIQALEPAYEEERTEFYRMDEHRRERFYGMAFDLGYCYYKLGEYARAYYYLELLHHSCSRFDYSRMYFNNLAEAEDVRLLSALMPEIDSMDKMVREIDASDDRGSEEKMNRREQLVNYIAFLRRKQGTGLIAFHDLDAAERVFSSLLDHQESHDYAEKELQRIADIRNNK